MEEKLKDIIEFLKRNGFKEMDRHEHYANDICSVVIENHGGLCDYYFSVANNNGDTIYGENANIYWLIGVLFYFNYVNNIVK